MFVRINEARIGLIFQGLGTGEWAGGGIEVS
jgi:hypothetical protein